MPSREVLNESISRSDWKENVFGSELRGGKNSHQTACGLSSSQTGLESLSFIKKKSKAALRRENVHMDTRRRSSA